ncbi:MAG: M56 family metallopeptidase [Candidatus Eisenbacteria bacterium]
MNLLAESWRAVLGHLWVATLLASPLILLASLARRAPARVLHLLWSAALLVIVIPTAIWAEALHRLLPVTPVGSAFLLRPLVAVSTAPADGIAWWAVLATLVWFIGATSAISVVARDLRAARRLGRTARPARDPHLMAAALSLGLEPRQIAVSDLVRSPVTVGMLRPLIVLSPDGAWSSAELRAALAHERYHLRRLDPLRLLLARIAASLFFFYPPVHMVLRGLEETNELLADSAALNAGNDADSLARALARGFEARILAPACLSAGLGRAAGFAARWDRIRNPRRYDNMTRGAVLLVFGLASLVTVGAWSAAARSGDVRKPAASVAEQLADSPPQVKPATQVWPTYPEAERKAQVEGTVIASGVVGVDGRVTEITMVKEVEGHPAFSEEAKRVLALWRFTPATKDGRPVAAAVQVPFAYRLH